METIETLKPAPGYTVDIANDPDPQRPDEWGDDAVFLVGLDSRDFWITRDGFDAPVMRRVLAGNKWEDDSESTEAEKISAAYFIYHLNVHSHSGVWLSLGDEVTAPVDDAFDRHLYGFVLIKKSEAPKGKHHAAELAAGLIKTWNMYLAGEVYGYTITDPDGETVDSCWGYYGDDGMKDIKKNAPVQVKQAKKIRDEKRAACVKKIKKSVRIYDTGAAGPVDRYTIIDEEAAFGMSDDPRGPQGFNQYIGDSSKIAVSACGKKITFDSLPKVMQEAIIDRIV